MWVSRIEQLSVLTSGHIFDIDQTELNACASSGNHRQPPAFEPMLTVEFFSDC
jgi:hypothetical protein